MSRSKKIVALLLALTFIVSFTVAGCGSKSATSTEKALTYNLGATPETLDPTMSQGLPEATIQSALMEGLYRYGADNKVHPAIAEKVDISKDGTHYVFTIRKGAKWTNGDPVTAHDFEYAWKRLLAKETAAPYAYQLYYLKNGEEYNKGNCTADQVGVKATDDYTLDVTLKAPTPYFLELTSSATLFPLDKKAVEGNKNWASDPKTFVGNGPFKMDQFLPQQKIVMSKNKDYWDAANVKLDKLTMTFVEDANTELSMYTSNQIDIAETVPTTDIKKLVAEKKAVILPDPSSYYYDFNVTKKPFDNKLVRQAFALAINRQQIVNEVTQAGQKPALGLVPYGFPDTSVTKDFRKVGGNYFKDNDVAKAKQLLAQAGYPDGKGLPPITITFNTDQGHQKIAEAIAQMWKTNLGANVTIQNQEWGVFIQNRNTGNYQVARDGWMPDYNDPMTFMDLNVTGGGNNSSKWSNPAYDKLIAEAKASNSETVRMKDMHEAEKILMDEMPVAPIYFYVKVNMIKPWVKGVFSPPCGSYKEFKWADVGAKK